MEAGGRCSVRPVAGSRHVTPVACLSLRPFRNYVRRRPPCYWDGVGGGNLQRFRNRRDQRPAGIGAPSPLWPAGPEHRSVDGRHRHPAWHVGLGQASEQRLLRGTLWQFLGMVLGGFLVFVRGNPPGEIEIAGPEVACAVGRNNPRGSGCPRHQLFYRLRSAEAVVQSNGLWGHRGGAAVGAHLAAQARSGTCEPVGVLDAIFVSCLLPCCRTDLRRGLPPTVDIGS